METLLKSYLANLKHIKPDELIRLFDVGIKNFDSGIKLFHRLLLLQRKPTYLTYKQTKEVNKNSCFRDLAYLRDVIQNFLKRHGGNS